MLHSILLPAVAVAIPSTPPLAPPAAASAPPATVVLVERLWRWNEAAVLILQNVFDDLPRAPSRDFVGFPIVGRQRRTRRRLHGRRNFLMRSTGHARARRIAFRLRGFVAFVFVIALLVGAFALIRILNRL